MSDLVKIARERIDDTRVTHWVGCERDHRECLIQRMADEIERLRAERDETMSKLANLFVAFNDWKVFHSTTRLEVELQLKAAERDELRRQLAEAEQDARRYRDWLRGGANIPSESTRWARWEVRYWDGRHWNTLFAEALDTSIDAAMGLTRPAEEA